MNILIPMAGNGSRFAKVGYRLPKPLIDVNGKPMVQKVVESLGIEANYIFLVLKEHYEKYDMSFLKGKIVLVEQKTEGAACTALLSKKLINNEEDLLIVNCDQLIQYDKNEFLNLKNDVDGIIFTFQSDDSKFSYSKINDEGLVIEVAEKRVISNNATTGHYYWKKGSDFVRSAEQMISLNIRTNNEFYICPVYNEAVKNGLKIKNFDVEKMMCLGTPEDLELYLKENKC